MCAYNSLLLLLQVVNLKSLLLIENVAVYCKSIIRYICIMFIVLQVVLFSFLMTFGWHVGGPGNCLCLCPSIGDKVFSFNS